MMRPREFVAMVLEDLGILFVLFCVIVILTGCSSRPKIPDKVATATAVACIDDEMRAELERECPALRTDDEILALDDYKVLQALRSDRGKATICIAKLKAAASSCAKVPAAGSSSSGRSAGLGGAGGDPAGADPSSGSGAWWRPWRR